MGFGQAVATVFSRYATFSGRARRSEFWWWYLFVLLLSIAVSVVVAVTGGYSIDDETGLPVYGSGTALLILLLWLVLVVPNIAVTVRRLHDTDRSGFWWFIGFVPLVGWIILLVLMVLEGTQGPNRYGPDPTYTGVPQG
ncbi:DUF805 domain-containing protein [Isoptericola aurantiacus]|uniref:DUF805 domain-containing protein n=1 Tax=Isoptericola aurantiacus TaxID=3377839 RepID=UPI00383B1133